MRKIDWTKPLSDEERKLFRRQLTLELLWSFFKPIIIGWSVFAIVGAIILALK